MLQADPVVLDQDRSIRHLVGEDEWRVRVELAACYRAVAKFGWTDLIYTHISATVPGPEHNILINPFGLGFDEVTASNLVKVGLDGTVLDDTPYTINRAGYLIHGAIHEARPEAACVLHLHTEAGMACSMLADGLRPLSQHAARFFNRIAFHDFEGIVLDAGEKDRLIRDLGPHRVMILRNHGFLTVGRTIGEAFTLMFYLEKAARAQLMAAASGEPLVAIPDDVAEHTARQFGDDVRPAGTVEWPALVRQLDREDRSYAR